MWLLFLLGVLPALVRDCAQEFVLLLPLVAVVLLLLLGAPTTRGASELLPPKHRESHRCVHLVHALLLLLGVRVLVPTAVPTLVALAAPLTGRPAVLLLRPVVRLCAVLVSQEALHCDSVRPFLEPPQRRAAVRLVVCTATHLRPQAAATSSPVLLLQVLAAPAAIRPVPLVPLLAAREPQLDQGAPVVVLAPLSALHLVVLRVPLPQLAEPVSEKAQPPKAPAARLVKLRLLTLLSLDLRWVLRLLWEALLWRHAGLQTMASPARSKPPPHVPLVLLWLLLVAFLALLELVALGLKTKWFAEVPVAQVPLVVLTALLLALGAPANTGGLRLHRPLPLVQPLRPLLGRVGHAGRPLLGPGPWLLQRPLQSLAHYRAQAVFIEWVARVLVLVLARLLLHLVVLASRTTPLAERPRVLVRPRLTRWLTLLDLHSQNV